ncbi:MAG TPA: PIN domain-containing protein, partial [Fluviicoccus sp.]|nr:PIN domain-containing protein [Fluviicoccus sp.]
MKDIFSWRLTPTKPYFSSLWDNALFIFDTSFLLDLYRVSNSSRDDFFKIIEKISNRIWLPYQVANEFFNNREKVIDSEAASYKKALTAVERWAVEQAEFSALKNQISQTGRIVSIELDDFFEKQKNFIDEVQKVAAILKESIENISAAHVATNNPQDHILEKILSFFDSRVGEPYSEKKLKDIYKTCEERYKENIPPGYMDISEKDDERKYNDYIIWHQIIEHAISTKKPIIFITSEKKEDWWLKKGGKIISPRPELRKEFKDLVNTD